MQIKEEIANYEAKLKEVDLNKTRLEQEIDNLPLDAKFRERKIKDMTLRLDGLYDVICELEEKIQDAYLRKEAIENEKVTLENIYKILKNFGLLYDKMNDEEKRDLIASLIKEVQIHPVGESDVPLKSIEFNFPFFQNGKEVNRLLLEKEGSVETIVLMSKVNE